MTRFAFISLKNIGLETRLLYSEISKTKKMLLEISFSEVDNEKQKCYKNLFPLRNPITLQAKYSRFKDSYHFLTKCDHTVLLLLTNDFLTDPGVFLRPS